MNRPGALPIVKAVEKILDFYNSCYSNMAKFRLVTNSSSLQTIDVLQALLRHAIAPSSVALEFWKFLQTWFDTVLEQHGDPMNLQSLVLIHRNSQWTTVADNLLKMSEAVLGDLTEGMNTHACNWITRLLLPIRSYGKTPGSLISDNSVHQRVAKFREQILKRDGYICPVTLLRDKAAFELAKEDEPLVELEAVHILPFAIGNSQSLVWKYIQTFTGDTRIQDTLHDINVVENGILLECNVHAAFGDLAWGIETKMENGTCRYFIEAFHGHVYFQRPGVGTGTELHFANESGDNPPNPDVCALHLAMCAVAFACGAAIVFNQLFKHDPDIIGPASGGYTLPTDPISDDFVIPYFERRLFEESNHLPTPSLRAEGA